MARKLFSFQNAAALLGGLALLSVVNSSAQGTVTTNQISLTTFEQDAAPTWSYGYFYGNNELGFYENNRAYYLPEDVDMTNALYQYAFDLTDLSGAVGYGTGTGAPLVLSDPAGFTTGERANYIVTFDARVEGLNEGQTDASAEMQLQFFIPNDAGGTTKSFQVNTPFRPTAEWTKFSFALDQGNVDGSTSEGAFLTNYTSTSALQFNVNFHEPHNQFGYDGGNVLFVDNFKVEVVNKPTTPPVETTPVTMADWNFDDKATYSQFNFQWSANSNPPVPTSANNANGEDPNTLGKDGTAGWFLNLDNSAFPNDPPAWAGGGTGGNGPVDYSLFDTPDLSLYRVVFDARVQGLAPDRTTSTAALQLHIEAPDDTVQPADEDATADFIIRLDVPITQVSSEWQTYTVTLNRAGVWAERGSKALFEQYHSAISELRTQWQIENIASETEWGFDAENTLIIDNFRLERLVPAGSQPTLNMARNNDQLVFTWNAPSASNIRLQSASSLNSQWTDVSGASSGHTVNTTGTMQFFRLVQE